MTWTRPPRPDWVQAINEGRIAPIAEEANLPLTLDALVAEASARQGRIFVDGKARDAAFGHPAFPAAPAFDRLGRFLTALEDEARLTPIGRWMTRRFLLRVLEVRLQLMDWLVLDPGVQDEPVHQLEADFEYPQQESTCHPSTDRREPGLVFEGRQEPAEAIEGRGGREGRVAESGVARLPVDEDAPLAGARFGDERVEGQRQVRLFGDRGDATLVDRLHPVGPRRPGPRHRPLAPDLTCGSARPGAACVCEFRLVSPARRSSRSSRGGRCARPRASRRGWSAWGPSRARTSGR